MYKIFVVEDDNVIASVIKKKLEQWGYSVNLVKNFNNVLEEYDYIQPHLVLMDIKLPYFDGFYWCSKIREMSNIPILFISSRDSEMDKIRAITGGGDDYLEKPFSIDLLIVKVQAMIRRAYSYIDESLNIFVYKSFKINLHNSQIYYNDKYINLTRNEYKILAYLIRNSGKIVTRTRLIKVLWDDESFVDDNTLTVNVNRLRKKLKDAGAENCIETIKGEGYKLK